MTSLTQLFVGPSSLARVRRDLTNPCETGERVKEGEEKIGGPTDDCRGSRESSGDKRDRLGFRFALQFLFEPELPLSVHVRKNSIV